MKELIQKIKTGLYAYQSLSEEEKTMLRNTLRPSETFSQEQISLLESFYLVPHESHIEVFTEILTPLRLGIVIKETKSGLKVINADLLTDCLEERDTWHPIKDYLTTSLIVYLEPTEFPNESEES